MPNRLIREGWLDSEAINQLTPEAERFFLRLCLTADDAGRFDGRRDILRSRLFPLKFGLRASDVEKLLSECVEQDLVIPYEWDTKPFLQITKCQRCSPCTVSKFPDKNGSFKIVYVKRETRDGEKDFVMSSLTHLEGIAKVSICLPPPLDQHVRECAESESGTKSKTLRASNESKPAAQADVEWLESLKSNPAYTGINISFEYGKLQAWCSVNGKQPTRKRFVNWLNRADRPMSVKLAQSVAPKTSAKPNQTVIAAKALALAVREDRIEEATKLKKEASTAVLSAAFSLLEVEQKNILSRLGREVAA